MSIPGSSIWTTRSTRRPAALRPDRREDGQLRLAAAGHRPCRSQAAPEEMFYKYGTTLRGLMTEHGISPDDFSTTCMTSTIRQYRPTRPWTTPFMRSWTQADLHQRHVAHAEKSSPALASPIISAISSTSCIPTSSPSRRWVPTASSWRRPASGLRPRPCSRTSPAISRRRTKLGMTTVLVVSDQNRDAAHLNATSGGVDQKHIHHITDDLAGFLGAIVAHQGKERA